MGTQLLVSKPNRSIKTKEENSTQQAKLG